MIGSLHTEQRGAYFLQHTNTAEMTTLQVSHHHTEVMETEAQVTQKEGKDLSFNTVHC